MCERGESVRETAWFSDRLMAAGQPTAALALTRSALERPDATVDARLVLRRARAFLALGRDREARVDLINMLSTPDMPSRAGCAAAGFRLLCEIALRAGQLDRASTLLGAALRLDPYHPRAAELRRVVGGWRAEARLLAAAAATAPEATAEAAPKAPARPALVVLPTAGAARRRAPRRAPARPAPRRAPPAPTPAARPALARAA